MKFLAGQRMIAVATIMFVLCAFAALSQTRPASAAASVESSSLTVGLTFACAIANNNDAYCWGTGSLGHAVSMPNETAALVDGGHKWVSLSASYNTCGITTAGDAYCWG